MNIIFKKSNLPAIDKVIHHNASGNENWQLAANILMGNDFSTNHESAVMLLERGAYAGDVWSMCQLARELYYSFSDRLAAALSWWHKAAAKKDAGALADLELLDKEIYEKIKNWCPKEMSDYAVIELRCALMTEYILTRIGRDCWNELPREERVSRVEQLFREASVILGVDETAVVFKPSLLFERNGVIEYADGMAHWEGFVEIKEQLLDSYERLIQVIFHEIGHIVVFSMWNSSDPRALRLRKIYGISEQRVNDWYRNADGICVPVIEEDPDTLSYGVYTTWGVYFA